MNWIAPLSGVETRTKRFHQPSSSSFVCTMCLYLLKHAPYLSLRHSHSVLCLCVLKFSTPLVSYPALSAVPACYASPYLSYILLFKGCNRYIRSARAMCEARAIYA